MEFTKDPSTHPSHGPLTEERLIRVRDQLAAAAKRSDGGNLGYMMADAAKAIDELLALRKEEQEPVGIINGARKPVLYSEPAELAIGTKPYSAPQLPQPAVQNMHHDAKCDLFRPQVVNGVFVPRHCDCRAAMLQGVEPMQTVTQLECDLSQANIGKLADVILEMNSKPGMRNQIIAEPAPGWITCSERMPVDNDIVLVVDDGYFVCEAQYRDGEFFSAVRGNGEFFETTCRDVELWMPLPAAPQQEADNG